MKIDYKLIKEDFLTHQLYTASQSELVVKRRKKSRLIVPIVYNCMSIFAYVSSQTLAGPILLLLFTLLWYIFYPQFSRWRYKSHYTKNIEANFSERINKKVEIEITSDSILAKDITGESTINGNQVSSIIELPTQFHIKLSTNVSFIIPIAFVEDRERLIEKIEAFGATYVDARKWQWK